MINNYITTVKRSWYRVFRNSKLLYGILGSVVLLGITVILFILFLQVIQHREGMVLYDPLLRLMPARDVSLYIFILLYGTIVLFIIQNIKNPVTFYFFIISYSFLLILRIVCIYLFPLELPDNYISLEDPFINNLIYHGITESKDLFFSGHTAVLFLMYLLCDNRIIKYILLASCFLLALLLLVQQAHYTVDILAAPAAAFVCYKATCYIHGRTRKKVNR